MNPTYSEELLIDLNVKLNCDPDDVSALSTIPYQIYYIGIDGTRDFAPTWDNTVFGCPATYEISRIEAGVERPLTAAEYAVLTHSTVDGDLSMTTSDYFLDSEIWTIRLYKVSTLSIGPNRVGEYIFDIEFRDICWDSDLLRAVFEEGEYIWDLWQFEQMVFTDMKDISRGKGFCRGVTSVLEYVSGPALAAGDDPSTVDLTHYLAVP